MLVTAVRIRIAQEIILPFYERKSWKDTKRSGFRLTNLLINLEMIDYRKRTAVQNKVQLTKDGDLTNSANDRVISLGAYMIYWLIEHLQANMKFMLYLHFVLLFHALLMLLAIHLLVAASLMLHKHQQSPFQFMWLPRRAAFPLVCAIFDCNSA